MQEGNIKATATWLIAHQPVPESRFLSMLSTLSNNNSEIVYELRRKKSGKSDQQHLTNMYFRCKCHWEYWSHLLTHSCLAYIIFMMSPLRPNLGHSAVTEYYGSCGNASHLPIFRQRGISLPVRTEIILPEVFVSSVCPFRKIMKHYLKLGHGRFL